MGLPTHILSLAALLAAAPAFGAVTLESVLASMDQSANSFRSMTGKLRKVTFTKILNDTGEPEIGAIKVKRGAGREMKLLVEVTSPDRRAYSLQGRKAEIYFPKLKMVQEYDLGKQKDVVDQFLLLSLIHISEPTRPY